MNAARIALLEEAKQMVARSRLPRGICLCVQDAALPVSMVTGFTFAELMQEVRLVQEEIEVALGGPIFLGQWIRRQGTNPTTDQYKLCRMAWIDKMIEDAK